MHTNHMVYYVELSFQTYFFYLQLAKRTLHLTLVKQTSTSITDEYAYVNTYVLSVSFYLNISHENRIAVVVDLYIQIDGMK